MDIVLEAVDVMGLPRWFLVELQAAMGDKRPALGRPVLFGRRHADFHGHVLLVLVTKMSVGTPGGPVVGHCYGADGSS
jgi:hypothetical protein